MLSLGAYSEQQRAEFAAVAELRVDGRRLGEIPPVPLTSSMHESRYSKKESETRILAHALVVSGIREADIHPRERPDFCVDLAGERIYVEVAELHEPESARWTNGIANISNVALDAYVADAKQDLGDLFLAFDVKECPPKTDGRRMIREIGDFIRSGAFRAVPRKEFSKLDPREFPTLARHASVYTSELANGHLQVKCGASSFDPLGLVPVASTVLCRKKKLAPTYDVMPDWLVLGATDMRGDFSASMTYFGTIQPKIDPFKRVIILGSGGIVHWKRSEFVATA